MNRPAYSKPQPIRISSVLQATATQEREREKEMARQEKERLEAEERERRDSKVQTVRYTEG